MKFFKSIKMCFSMFTIFSLPCIDWDETERKNMLLSFPFVGLYIGILWSILIKLSLLISNEKLLYILVIFLSMFSLFASGFIHLDGFLDVSDAIGSRASLEKKLQILKDSHVGSFAVINLVILFFTNYFTFLRIYQYISLNKNTIYSFMPLMILCTNLLFSRLMSSFMLINYKKIGESEYADNNIDFDNSLIKHNKFITKILIIIAILFILLNTMFLLKLFPSHNLFMTLRLVLPIFSVIISHMLVTIYCFKIFKGVNGDVSGYAICISECIGMIVLLILL